MNERTLLQLAVSVSACIPIAGGAGGMIFGASLIGPEVASISLDSHLRYLSGLLFATGLGFLSTISRIEAKGPRFRLLTFLVLTGGLARLAGILIMGVPSSAMLFGLGMELVVAPLLYLWQTRISRRF